MTNDDLRRDVTAELDWDPQVDSTAIEVSAAAISFAICTAKPRIAI